MKTIVQVKIGLDSENIGSRITLRSITGITFAGYVVVGFRLRKLRSTIPFPEHRRTRLILLIFNQPMATVTITRGAKDGNQK